MSGCECEGSCGECKCKNPTTSGGTPDDWRIVPLNFMDKLLTNMVDLPPEFSKVVDEHWKELV
jgi:hypothetical protein